MFDGHEGNEGAAAGGEWNIPESVQRLLLRDRTTRRNIQWGTDNYLSVSPLYTPESEINESDLKSVSILPRVKKSAEEQLSRTRDKAEVFTPSWICAIQNNQVDEAWFGWADSFCIIDGAGWKTVPDKVSFPEGKSWKDYVEDIRLEITCGEAPYLTSRYDTVTGDVIPIEDRIGLLDRKLRVVSENCDDEDEWCFWARRAIESVYGYDFQGDNVFLARKNILLDFCEYMYSVFGHYPNKKTLQGLATVISWNIWQMDGLNNSVPFSSVPIVQREEDLFGFVEENIIESPPVQCRIYDWKANRSVEFRSMIR